MHMYVNIYVCLYKGTYVSMPIKINNKYRQLLFAAVQLQQPQIKYEYMQPYACLLEWVLFFTILLARYEFFYSIIRIIYKTVKRSTIPLELKAHIWRGFLRGVCQPLLQSRKQKKEHSFLIHPNAYTISACVYIQLCMYISTAI